MTATTANRGYPYPQGSDFLGDTAAHIQALAEDVDADLARVFGVRYKQALSQSLANATWTRVTWNAATTLAGLTTSGDGLAVPAAGLYHVIGQVQFAANATGDRSLVLTHNNPAGGLNGLYIVAQHQLRARSEAAEQTHIQASAVVACSAGALLELWARQSSGAALNLESVSTGGNPQVASHLTVAKVSP